MIDFNPIIFKDPKKEKIQREAYNKWLEHGCRGALEMSTGCGKTLIGIMAIQQNISCSVVIAVPQISLMNQWYSALLENLSEFKNIQNHVGRIGGGFSEWDKSIKICVINSIRDKYMEADLLILDEIHHIPSQENIKFLKKGGFKRIMGLSATVTRQDGEHKQLDEYAPVIYTHSQKEAIDDGILSQFELINYKVYFSLSEQKEYNRIDSFIRENFSRFGNDFKRLQYATRLPFPAGRIARDVMGAFTNRRNIVLNAKSKIEKTVELVKANQESKILIFSEYIKIADEIAKRLKQIGIPVGKYHSNMNSKKKNDMLEDFKGGKISVMVSVKSLDEGTNIPLCDMAIITGGTGVQRQMIQRLGRILRTVEGKRIARVIQLYIPQSKDYDWMMNRHKELIKNARKVTWI